MSVTKVARDLTIKTGKSTTTRRITAIETSESGYTVDFLLELLDLLSLEIEIKERR